MAKGRVVDQLVFRLIGDPSLYLNMLRTAEWRMKQFGQRMRQLGGQLSLRITAPLTAIGTGAAIEFGRFEEALSNVEGLVGIAGERVQQMGNTILDSLTGETGQAPVELAQGLFFVTSAGLRGQRAMDTLRTSARASAAGLGETRVVANLLTSAMNAYESSNLTAAQAADILTASVREGKLEAESIAPVLGNILPTASRLGISFQDVSATLAVLSRTGTDAANGATQISAVMTSLLRTTEQGQAALAGAGLSLGQLREMAAGPGGLIQVMRTLDQTFQGDMETLGQIIPNVRAFRAMMGLLGQRSEVVDSVMSGVRNSTGALDHAFESATGTIKFQFMRAVNLARVALIKIGDILAPVLRPVIDAFATMFRWFNKLPKPIKLVIAVIAAIAAAIGPVLIIVGVLASAFGAIVGVIGTIGSILAAVFSPMGLAIAGIIVAIAALAALILGPVIAAIAIWVNSMGGIQKAWEAIQNAALAFWNWLNPILIAIKDAAIATWIFIRDAAIRAWNEIQTIAIRTWNKIKPVLLRLRDIAIKIWGFVQSAAIRAWLRIRTAAMAFWNWIRPILIQLKNIAITVWDFLVDKAVQAWNVTLDAAMAFWNWIRPILLQLENIAVAVWELIGTIVFTVWERIKQAAITAWGAIQNAVSSAKDFIIGVITRVWTVVSGIFGNISGDASISWEDIQQKVLDVLIGIEFGLRNMEQVMSLVWLGARIKFLEFTRPVRHFFEVVLPTILGWIGRQFGNTFETMFNFARTVFTNLGTNVANIFAEVRNALQNFVRNPLGGVQINLADAWRPLTEGFRNTIEGLPEIAAQEMSPLERQLRAEFQRQAGTLTEAFQEFRARRLRELAAGQDQSAVAGAAAAAGLALERENARQNQRQQNQERDHQQRMRDIAQAGMREAVSIRSAEAQARIRANAEMLQQLQGQAPQRAQQAVRHVETATQLVRSVDPASQLGRPGRNGLLQQTPGMLFERPQPRQSAAAAGTGNVRAPETERILREVRNGINNLVQQGERRPEQPVATS